MDYEPKPRAIAEMTRMKASDYPILYDWNDPTVTYSDPLYCWSSEPVNTPGNISRSAVDARVPRGKIQNIKPPILT